MSNGTQFVATHNITPHDVSRASQLGARKRDLVLSVIVVVVLVAILAQVLYSFALYLFAVAGAPENFIAFLRFETGDTSVAALSWLSVVVTLSLPIFLFYALRSLAETLHPAWKVRRLGRSLDILGPTTYTIDERGVRSLRDEGAEVFLPWTTFDAVRSDGDIAVLFTNDRPKFFIPLAAFGRERDEVLAQIRSRIPPSG